MSETVTSDASASEPVAAEPEVGDGEATSGVDVDNSGSEPETTPTRVRRHQSDLLRFIVGALILVIVIPLGMIVELPAYETALHDLANYLPNWVESLAAWIMQIGSLFAVGVFALIALGFRKWRMARDLVVAGVLAWVVAIALAWALGGRDAIDTAPATDIMASVTDHGFPSPHVAVAAAIATAVAPYIGRSFRRWSWAVVVLVAIARIYVGARLPLDVFGGVVLGWTLGSLVHLVFGAREKAIPLDEVRAALMRAGIRVMSMRPLDIEIRGGIPYLAETDTGRRLAIRIAGRDQRDADLLYKLYRYIFFRNIEDEAIAPTPKRAVEHAAYLTLLAERADVRTMAFVAETVTTNSDGISAVEFVDGEPLDRRQASEVSAALLADIWTQAIALREARIAHRDLRVAHLWIAGTARAGDGSVYVMDFGDGEAAAGDEILDQDVAQLLASLATRVGVERAIDSAVASLGPDTLARALPFLQPLVLDTTTRSALRAQKTKIKELRSALADKIGAEDDKPVPIVRVRVRSLIGLLAIGLAIYLIVPQIAEFQETFDEIQRGNYLLLAVALVGAVTTYFFAAIQLTGCVPTGLPLWRTFGAQVASDFTNRFTPAGLGGMGLNERYLEKLGIDRTAAVSAVGMRTVAGGSIHGILMVPIGFAIGAQAASRFHIGWTVLWVVLVVLGLFGLLMLWPRVRRLIWKYLENGFVGLWEVLKRPSKAAQLIGGSFGVTFSYIMSFLACVYAFGGNIGVLEGAFVFLAGAGVGTAAPTPGGLGAWEAALIAFLVAFGVDNGTAVAATLSFRLFTFWLPVIPGLIIFRHMEKNEEL